MVVSGLLGAPGLFQCACSWGRVEVVVCMWCLVTHLLEQLAGVEGCFFQELGNVLSRVPQDERYVLMGDLNAVWGPGACGMCVGWSERTTWVWSSE